MCTKAWNWRNDVNLLKKEIATMLKKVYAFVSLAIVTLLGSSIAYGYTEEEQYLYDKLFLQLPWEAAERMILTQENRDTPTHLVGSVDEYALDFGLNLGTPVVAAAPGVAYVYREGKTKAPAYGNHIKIDHGYFYTLYAHLSSISEVMDGCDGGCEVWKGVELGLSGNTGVHIGPGGGYHLHFGLYHGYAWNDGYSYSVQSKIVVANEGLGPYRTLQSTQFENGQYYLSGNFEKGHEGIIVCGSDGCYVDTSQGTGGGGGSTPTNSPAQINYVRGRIANVSDFEHGLTIYVNQAVNIEIETQVKNETGSDVKADFFFYLDDDKDFGFDSSHAISGSDSDVTVKANSKTEKHSDPIRVNVSTPRTLYFYSQLTSAGASDYSHSNNSEQYFKLDIVAAQNVDLIISQAQLVGQKTQITMGANYRFEMAIRNIGLDTPLVGIQSVYYLMKPAETNFTEIEQDGSDASELSPGRDQWESTPTSGYIPDRVGIHRVKVCTDINNNIPETDETNNCKEFTFEVLPAPPTVDFIISGLGFKEGTSIKKGSKVHPWANVRNIGTTNPIAGIRIAYYIDGDYRDDDGVDANQLTPGRDQKESVDNDNIKLGNTGTRTLNVCADYQNSVAEMNESNNCSSITFKVKK